MYCYFNSVVPVYQKKKKNVIVNIFPCLGFGGIHFREAPVMFCHFTNELGALLGNALIHS